MSYSVDELFEFFKISNGYAVIKYQKNDDASVTELEIPAEYNGLPVVKIAVWTFWECRYLREISVPDNVKIIDGWAFENCPELRKIELPKQIKISPPAFIGCPKLMPEIVMAGIVGCPEDLSAPIKDTKLLDWNGLLRPDVFELVLKYDSFRLTDTEMLFWKIVSHGLFLHFEALEKAGKSPSAEETDALIEFSSENGCTEMTAYLLEYKNRKFGFQNGGDQFEL